MALNIIRYKPSTKITPPYCIVPGTHGEGEGGGGGDREGREGRERDRKRGERERDRERERRDKRALHKQLAMRACGGGATEQTSLLKETVSRDFPPTVLHE